MSEPPRLTALRAKLKARKGMPGFEANVRAIEEEIARIEAEQPKETTDG